MSEVKLYKIDLPVAASTLREYEEGKTLTPLNTFHREDKIAMKRAALLECIFVHYPTPENARKWLRYIWPLVERFHPEDEDGSDFQTSGFLPTGRILVTQGRALPEFSEYWTSASYSAFILQKDGGWDCNEYTGSVLRQAGLNGRGFPVEPWDESYSEEDDLVDWTETAELVSL